MTGLFLVMWATAIVVVLNHPPMINWVGEKILSSAKYLARLCHARSAAIVASRQAFHNTMKTTSEIDADGISGAGNWNL